MHFILQRNQDKTGRSTLDIDVRIVRDILDQTAHIHSYSILALEELKEKDLDKDNIPVGTIDFVQVWLKNYYGISKMEPIEIPVCLQSGYFLGRAYAFVQGKDLPKTGQFFVKRADALKELSFSGEIGLLWQAGMIHENGIYQLSELVDFISEWRVFVHDWHIENCVNYDGDPLIAPDKDVIRRALIELVKDSNTHYPKAFTLDVGILSNGRTVLIEMHPWCSVGLYSYLFGNDLPYCYADGIAWYIIENIPYLYLC